MTSEHVDNGPVARFDAMLRVSRDAGALVAAAERADLQRRLVAAERRMVSTKCNVFVVGEFKQGKSSLVNALVGAPICPVNDDVATARPTEVVYGETTAVEVVLEDGDGDRPGKTRTITLNEIPSYAAEPLDGVDADKVLGVRVQLKRQLLLQGLQLIDTPGVGGLGSTHATMTIRALPNADAVLFVTDASQELTASEVQFLRTVRSLCPTVACVMTKIDFYSSWRQVRAWNDSHFDSIGLSGIKVFPTSALLREAYLRHDGSFPEMQQESGYGDLMGYLRNDLVVEVEGASIRRCNAAIVEVLVELEAQLSNERAVLEDPSESGQLMRRLAETKDEADRLRGQSARWHNVLMDGYSDLQSDVDHDLRSRFRELQKEVEEYLETVDPATAWDEFEVDLVRRTTAAVVANFTVLREQADELATKVSDHFELDHSEIAGNLNVTQQLAAELLATGSVSGIERPSARAQAVSTLRATTGGITTLRILFGSVGFGGFIAPVTMAAGLLFGRNMVKEERNRQLHMRRSQAKMAARKYLDDALFLAGKDTRDAMRMVHRQLRDHFQTRAEELRTSADQSYQAALRAQRASVEARQERTTQLDGLRRQLDAVSRALQAVNPGD